MRAGAHKTGLRANLGYFADYRGVFLPLYGALALFAMGISAATGWGAVLLTRTFGYTIGDAGKALGSGQILWAIAGAALASVLVDRVARRAGPVGKVYLAGALALAAIPAALAVFAPSGAIAVVLLAEIMGASALYGTTMLSVIAEITPVRVRGLSVALYAFVMTMIGGSLGPIAVAFLTEQVFRRARASRLVDRDCRHSGALPVCPARRDRRSAIARSRQAATKRWPR